MTDTTPEEQLGGGFAEVRDGETVEPVVRPEERPAGDAPAS